MFNSTQLATRRWLTRGKKLSVILYIFPIPKVAVSSFLKMILLYYSLLILLELECSLSSDMARISHFCQQWRLKPSASKTISSVFPMHNTSATRELSVYLDGQCLRHECHLAYLVVTLDCTPSSREHLTKTAGKLKNRNNLLMKLAGSTWGASANTLRSSALALCYSAAEYCAPVWSRCDHTSRVDVQLNSTMRLISGTSILHLSDGFQRSPTLNCQPYKGRLPLTSRWRKSSNITVGQYSLISLAHHCYD